MAALQRKTHILIPLLLFQPWHPSPRPSRDEDYYSPQRPICMHLTLSTVGTTPATRPSMLTLPPIIQPRRCDYPPHWSEQATSHSIPATRKISAPHSFGILSDGLNQNEQEPISKNGHFGSTIHVVPALRSSYLSNLPGGGMGYRSFFRGGLGGVGGGFGTSLSFWLGEMGGGLVRLWGWMFVRAACFGLFGFFGGRGEEENYCIGG